MAEDAANRDVLLVQGLSDSTRDRLLASAAEVFVRRGVRACTVQEILDEAGLSRRTFYQHFKNKDELVEALYHHSVAWFVATMTSASKSSPGSVVEVTDQLFDTYMTVLDQSGPLVGLLHAEANHPASSLYPRRMKMMEDLAEVMAAEGSRRTGRALDPLEVRVVLQGIEIVVLTKYREGTLDASTRAHLKRVARALAQNL